jgi:alpha-tubulin suppressor-like RCC1 family protein
MFGNGTVDPSPTPVLAAGGARYASLTAYRIGTCALAEDRHAQCWGNGGNGAIGNGLFQDALSPADVNGGYRFLELASSGSSDFVCGIATGGRAYCWGWGEFGQLGNGAFLSCSEPVLVRLDPTP